MPRSASRSSDGDPAASMIATATLRRRNPVLHVLHVETGAAQPVQDVGEDADPVQVPHGEGGGAGRLGVRLTQLGVSPWTKASRISTTPEAIASCACWVDAPMWWVPTTRGCWASGELHRPPRHPGSSASTSSPARGVPVVQRLEARPRRRARPATC